MKAYTINQNGRKAIQNKLDELDLDWSVEGTASEIWQCSSFDESLENNGYFDYELHKDVHGMNWMTITLDHVDVHEVEE